MQNLDDFFFTTIPFQINKIRIILISYFHLADLNNIHSQILLQLSECL